MNYSHNTVTIHNIEKIIGMRFITNQFTTTAIHMKTFDDHYQLEIDVWTPVNGSFRYYVLIFRTSYSEYYMCRITDVDIPTRVVTDMCITTAMFSTPYKLLITLFEKLYSLASIREVWTK